MKRVLLLVVTFFVLIAIIIRLDSSQQIAHSQSTSSVTTVPLYRLHNYSTDQYYWTTSDAERDNFINQGWTYEKIIGHVCASSSSSCTAALYRINTSDPNIAGGTYSLVVIDTLPTLPLYPIDPIPPIHHSSATLSSGSSIIDQTILGYVSSTSLPSSQPLWQAYNQIENSYFVTGNLDEYNDKLPGGWRADGIFCYLPSSTTLGSPGWPKQFGTVGNESISPILVDHSGSVYVVGSSAGSLFGTNTGTSNCFAAKYDTSGNLLWGKQFGSSSTDLISSACVDSGNNLYVVGTTDGNLFGTNAGGTDAFVTKFSPNGVVLWSKQLGTPTQDFANSVAVDAQNNVYVAGETGGSLFGQNSGADANLYAAIDAYIVEYDTNGNQLWTKQFGAGGTNSADRIRFDNAGNFYVAGGTASLFGPDVTGYDSYVAKYSPTKTLLWGKQFGSVNPGDRTDSYGLCVDASGNVYVAGGTNMHDDIDGNPDTGDGYITKFNTNGNSLWTQRWATAADDSVNDICLDSQGNIYAVGETAGLLFAPFTGSDHNGVVAKYDSNGNLISGIQYGAFTNLASIAVDTQDRLYLAGGTSASLFGPCAGGEDVFVQRLNSGGQMAKAIQAQLPKTRSVVDALGVRLAVAKHPLKTVIQCAWAGKIVTLNRPSILVNNRPYMYIGYTAIATQRSRIGLGKGEHKEVAMTSSERQVIVRYGSSNYVLNGKTKKCPVSRSPLEATAMCPWKWFKPLFLFQCIMITRPSKLCLTRRH